MSFLKCFKPAVSKDVQVGNLIFEKHLELSFLHLCTVNRAKKENHIRIRKRWRNEAIEIGLSIHGRCNISAQILCINPKQIYDIYELPFHV